ncbi:MULTISPECIES: prolipoprotein diacylglyceryl transferase [unclassified Streptomyces]|uniref:prolipoprotein diacylglyceryl transferase n=1 Tax=unclassified Streptomyces TaxID=2593676 RepID=UPI000BF4EAD6|nr:prolipoprotein diacylglyceryl transferase [Streptomyces sp. Ru87]PGH50871.1 prolipoprotein diacylglyceryl transferase [Streptomyces sp. Ru87]
MDLAYIPSPSTGVIELGPVPLRGYAFCILIGVFVAVWLGGRRWIARGGLPGTVADIAVWAVPFGLVGGRLYHVCTTYEPYFGENGDWVDAFKIWEGGLGIWGAIALGAVGAWIGARRRGVPLPAYADAVAPGIAFAQAIGRWGNWFNQELYGKATDLPWALKIDAEHTADGLPGTFHPTFLYESLWCVGVALLVIWADRRFKLGHGRAFALYVAAYTVGRGWIEYMRIDEAHHILGLRLNVWTSILVFLAAVAYLIVSARVSPGREEIVEPAAEEARAAEAAGESGQSKDPDSAADPGSSAGSGGTGDAGGSDDADGGAVPDGGAAPGGGAARAGGSAESGASGKS